MIFLIIGFAVAGILFRPFGLPEAIAALAGAVMLVVLGLLPWRVALHGAGQGMDVYLFLVGMMLLAELAASQGLFAWAAGLTARHAGGSAARLFTMIYTMAVIITVFFSNDATAVVFTPAVAAMAREVKAKNPLPFLLICAFVANAASFVLPISNPANLVVYGSEIPKLLPWLGQFLLASSLAIAATYWVLRWTQRGALREAIHEPASRATLSPGGRLAGVGLAGTALVLMAASAFGFGLGLPTFLASLASLALVLIPSRTPPWPLLKNISWSILLLVVALFVMVAALDRSGAALTLGRALQQGSIWGAGIGLGLLGNIANNLPAGLLAGHALAAAHAEPALKGAALIGIDLGPNLSVTGSLATILWLTALRREGVRVTAGEFLRLGALVMPPALLLAIFGVVAAS